MTCTTVIVTVAVQASFKFHCACSVESCTAVPESGKYKNNN